MGRKYKGTACVPFLFYSQSLCSCVQHIFNENSVTGSRVIDQHMGDGADQFAVLDDGAAAHVCVKYRTTIL